MAISGLYYDNAWKTATEPEAYINTVKLFGDSAPNVLPYYWKVEGGFESDGPMIEFFYIMSAKINKEGEHRRAVISAEEINKTRSSGQSLITVKPFEDVYKEWDTGAIIKAFEVLNKYNALYFQNRNDKMPPEYFCTLIKNKNDMDLIKPYYPVFDYLLKISENVLQCVQ